MPRYVYYTFYGKHRWGRVVDDGLINIEGTPFDYQTRDHGGVIPWDLPVLDPPVRPSKIVCVGRNYRDHAAELGNAVPAEPLLFLKPPSALVGHEGAIEIPTGLTELVHHEGELAVVIARRTRRIDPAQAHDHILGYTLMNDVTARDLQRKDGQFTRGKGLDTFAPLGPWLDTDFRPADQRLTVTVNGALRQEGRLSDMIFDIPTLVAFISRHMTLEQGDVIATGTPAGVGPLQPGDVVEVSCEGLGTLRNPVVEAPL